MPLRAARCHGRGRDCRQQRVLSSTSAMHRRVSWLVPAPSRCSVPSALAGPAWQGGHRLLQHVLRHIPRPRPVEEGERGAPRALHRVALLHARCRSQDVLRLRCADVERGGGCPRQTRAAAAAPPTTWRRECCLNLTLLKRCFKKLYGR